MKLSNQKILVKLNLENFSKELHGTLQLGLYQCLTINSQEINIGLFTKLSEEEKKKINCESDSQSYTLWNNIKSGVNIYPKYVTPGKMENDITGIEIFISELSDWMEKTQVISFDALKLKDKRCQIICDFKSIKIISLESAMSLKIAIHIAHEVKCFFSILLMHPLSIEFLWLLYNNKQNRKPIYFDVQSANRSTDKTSWYFIGCKQISEVGWNNIFNNYNSNHDYFTKVWARLPLILKSTGIFDYDILGAFSMIDAYCSIYIKEKKKKLKNFPELKKKLLSVVNNFSEGFKDDEMDVIKAITQQVENIVNSNLPSFQKKFDLMIKNCNVDIINALKFSDDDLKKIRKIRNLVAHGNFIEKSIDYSDIFRLINKLLVLSMYLIYRDLGFTSRQFASILRRPNKFVLNADINKIAIDKLSGSVPFWTVDEDSLKSVTTKKLNFYVGVKYSKSKNKYRYSKSLTRESHNWLNQKEKKHQNLIEYIYEKHFTTSITNIEFFGLAYFVSGNNTIELNGALLCTYL